MSASKKKKERQAIARSDKLSKTHAEQTAYRRKVRTYTAIGVVVVILVAALLTWNSGIFQRRATAATVGDTQISVSELSFYYNNVRYMYAQYGIIDPTKPDSEQMYNETEGKTYRDFFLETALNQAKTTKAQYDAALKAGYTLNDIQADLDNQIKTDKDTAAQSLTTLNAYIRSVYGRYVTTDSYKEFLAQSMLASKYYNDMLEKTSDGFTDAQLDEYYQSHKDDVDTFEYSYLYFKAEDISDKDAQGNPRSSEEITRLKTQAKTDAKNKADKALAAYQEGTVIAKLINEYAPSDSKDHTKTVGKESISSSYRDQLLGLEKDAGTVVENPDAGYYVVMYHGRQRDESKPATIRDILIRAETTTDEAGKAVAPTQEAWDAAKAKADEVMSKWESSDKTAETFGQLASQYSAASTSSNGGITTGVKAGSLTDGRNAWLFDEERTPGDVTTTKHEDDPSAPSPYWGYHISYFQEWEEESWRQNVRATLTDEAMTKWSEELVAGDAYTAALSDGAKYLGK